MKRTCYSLLPACLLLLLLTGTTQAQEAVITGAVTDNRGEPLIGANVLIEELVVGSVTDADGRYRIALDASGEAATLVARFIGYEEARRSIRLEAGTQEQDFALNEDFLDLDEVVVTGVGEATSTKRLGINVESVSEERLQAAPALTVESALAGKIAGAQITQTSGQPGVAAAITLRGINSLGGTTPMILIDGVQISTESNYAGTSEDGSTSGGTDIFFNASSRLADIDYSDVERIEVVKGAAAATIYGAQGANGVIQIFTKKGQAGRPRLSVTTSLTVDDPIGEVEKAQFHFYDTEADGTIQGVERDPETGQWTFPSFGITPESVNDKPFMEETFNQVDDVLRTAQTQRYGVSLSGGNELITYLLSANVLDQEGVVNTTFQKRNSYRANFGIKPLPNLNIDVRTNFIDVRNRGTETGDNVEAPFSQALFTPQFIDLAARDEAGRLVATPIKDDNGSNPLFEFGVVSKDIETVRFISGVSASYRPLAWLELDYKVGVDHYRYDYDELITNFEDNEIATLSPKEGRITKIADQSTNLTSTLSSFFRFDLRPRLLSSTQFAFDVRSERFNQTFTRGQGLPPFETATTLRSTSSFNVDEFTSRFNTYGFLVNEKLDWRGALGVSFGGRFDYSSAFGEGEEASFFPRGDIYWRPSEFAFWNSLRATFTEFKVRAAYGEAGIQPGPFDRVLTLAQETIGSNTGLVPRTTLQNARLSVEESREFEAGADATFRLGGRVASPISLSYTYWNRTTGNVIEEIDVAPSTGAADLLTNGVDIHSYGSDLSLSLLTYYTEAFNWRTTLNLGFATSLVDNIDSGEDIVVREKYLLREGEEVGTHFGFRAVRGLDERVDPDDGASDFILDLDADGDVDADDGTFVFVDGKVVEAGSRQVMFRPFKERLGNPSPDFTLGFRNDFALQELSFGFQFDWVQGPDIYNQTKQWLYRDGLHADWDEPVSIGGETAAYAAYYQSIYKTNDKNEFFVEDGSFLRLREAYVSYDIAGLVNRVGRGRFIESFRLSLTGRNLFTFDDYDGFDPEVSHNGGDPRIRGLDEFTYPRFRSVTFGTSVRF